MRLKERMGIMFYEPEKANAGRDKHSLKFTIVVLFCAAALFGVMAVVAHYNGIPSGFGNY